MGKPDFSEADKTVLSELAKEREHRRWLFEILKRWAQWVAAISVGGSVIWDKLHDLIKLLREP